MTYDKTSTIEGFLSATAAKQPTPGGGSVAALVGALAAALGEMTVNYSVGKKSLAQHQSQLTTALAEFARARQVLLELVVEDQAAYEAFTAIRKLPETDPQRRGRFDAALLACIRVPQAIGITAAAVLELCDQLADRVSRYLLSDLAVCAELAMATVRSAAYNVRINLVEVADAAERKRFDAGARQQVAHATLVIRRAIPRILAAQGLS
jgi:methenyltetrahydrofolate cyclohydrolase